MSSNTASSSAGVTGSADSTAPRRNSKKPKCNFFSKDLIFMDYLFIYYLLLLLLFLVEFWFPSMSTHLLICWVFTWVLLERWECESQAWAWEVRLVRGVSLRGKTVRGVREKEKRNKTTQHFRVQIRPVRMWRKKMLERCGRGVRDIQRGRESELDCLSWVRVRRKGRGREARAWDVRWGVRGVRTEMRVWVLGLRTLVFRVSF